MLQKDCITTVCATIDCSLLTTLKKSRKGLVSAVHIIFICLEFHGLCIQFIYFIQPWHH